MVFEQCKDILLKESDLVQRIAALQKLIYDAVVNREWTDFEGHFDALSGLGEEFAALEDMRDGLFAKDQGGERPSFYSLAAQLPREQRKEITDIYRKFKIEFLKVRMSGETLMGYIAGARATMAGFFEVAFPGRGGKIYSPHGVPVSHDMRSMVLNQSF
jgi:hypothetical protein